MANNFLALALAMTFNFSTLNTESENFSSADEHDFAVTSSHLPRLSPLPFPICTAAPLNPFLYARLTAQRQSANMQIEF